MADGGAVFARKGSTQGHIPPWPAVVAPAVPGFGAALPEQQAAHFPCPKFLFSLEN